MSQLGIFSDNTPGNLDVETLTGNSGGAVSPDASHNIDILGSGGINVVGNPGTNTLTISSSGGGISWNVIGSSQNLAINNGYICTSGAALSLALPATSSLGDKIELVLDGSTSWTITQPNVGSQIRMGSSETTLGVGGSLASTAQGDSVTLICETADARWVVVASMGSITIV